MKRCYRLRLLTSSLLSLLLLNAAAQAGDYNIQLGSTVEEDVPDAGAGRLDAYNEIDTYRFNGTAGQLVFFYETSQDSAFEGWLRWKVTGPNGHEYVNEYLDSSSPGRIKLDETGVYQVKVSVGDDKPSLIGTYSFSSHIIPPNSTFSIAVGDTVAPGQPQAGSGRIEVVGAQDYYTFSGTAGQLVFFEEVLADASFGGWLHWELLAPSGTPVFSEYLGDSNVGRVQLPESGTYKIGVSSSYPEMDQLGDYSFRLRPIAADQQFNISIGDTVSSGVPSTGAGRIETDGARDIYTFQGSAGQALYFQDISAAPAFHDWLGWSLVSPSGTNIFLDYLNGADHGRVDLTETGTYRIEVYVRTVTTGYTGDYSFRVRTVSADQQFNISIGDTVSSGVPSIGAGRIETDGARDTYLFQASAGQALFFEDISAAAEFRGWLAWNLVSPSGTNVFLDFMEGVDPGRVDLTETGAYRIQVYVRTDAVGYTGDYSFRIRDIGADARFPITLGQTVSSGVPAAGAGVIESAGGQDQYRFEGTAGQRLILEEVSSDTSFDGWLWWELKAPSGAVVGAGYFDAENETALVLPSSGTYNLRVYSADQNPAHIGNYSVRIYSPVRAWADNLAVAPGKSLLVPSAKFFCNDVYAPGDSLTFELPSNVSAEGGLLAVVAGVLSYTPRVGFTGVDTFMYRIRGQWGGVNTAQVTVRVLPAAEGAAMVVSLARTGPASARVCLLGAANHTYRVEESTDLQKWTFKENLTAASNGEMLYEYQTTAGLRRYFRFSK